MTKIKTVCGSVIFVDASLAPFLQRFTWRLVRSGRTAYASTTIDGRTVAMHRLLANPAPRQHVDHVDGNGRNNTLVNLRVATPAQNGANKSKQKRSKYIGVSIRRTRGGLVYTATTNAGGCGQVHGTFKTEIEAARARDVAAFKLWGVFAKLNFPSEV